MNLNYVGKTHTRRKILMGFRNIRHMYTEQLVELAVLAFTFNEFSLLTALITHDLFFNKSNLHLLTLN